MTTHPYPQKIRQAVAETVARQILVMKDWGDLNSQTQYAFLTDADEILTALWQVDQPSTISADEARLIWFKAVDAHTGDTESMHELRALLAKHAPDWGDQG